MADKYKSDDGEIVEAFQLGIDPSPEWFLPHYRYLLDFEKFRGYYIVKTALDFPIAFTERSFKREFEPII